MNGPPCWVLQPCKATFRVSLSVFATIRRQAKLSLTEGPQREMPFILPEPTRTYAAWSHDVCTTYDTISGGVQFDGLFYMCVTVSSVGRMELINYCLELRTHTYILENVSRKYSKIWPRTKCVKISDTLQYLRSVGMGWVVGWFVEFGWVDESNYLLSSASVS